MKPGIAAQDGPVLRIANLVKAFDRGRVVAVDDICIDVYPGEIVSILGPSGCGKTTTLRIVAGLEQPDSGDVVVDGRSVLGLPPHKRNVGLVFQDLALFPHKTIAENVAFGLRMKHVKPSERKSQVEDMLRLVELPPEEFGQRMPTTLSGGQQQRVALARTLVVRPALVLFDEPMSALDRRLRDRMAGELRQIQKRLGVASVYVTHDQETASMMSDRLVVMDSGRIMQVGTPLDVYRAPRSRFVADFIGDMNFVPARVVDGNGAGACIELFGRRIQLSAAGWPVGAHVTLAVRPENLNISRTQTSASLAAGSVVAKHFVGGRFLYKVRLHPGSEVVVHSHRNELAAEGESVWIEADPAALQLLED